MVISQFSLITNFFLINFNTSVIFFALTHDGVPPPKYIEETTPSLEKSFISFFNALKYFSLISFAQTKEAKSQYMHLLSQKGMWI